MNRVFKNLNKRVFSILLVTLLTGFFGLPIVNAETNSNIYEFNYTGDYQTFVVPRSGIYKLETWGAQGGHRGSNNGGKGGYATGEVYLKRGDTLYIYVGGNGQTHTGYNGGGFQPQLKIYGGGATDIRFVSGEWNNETSLKSRLIVGGGGGSVGSNSNTGGAGGVTGGSTSGCGSGGIGASLSTAGSLRAGFGYGGDGTSGAGGYAGAGGGGWYGGGGANPDHSQDDDRGGGGGSSFTWNTQTKQYVPTGYSVSEDYFMTSVNYTDGNRAGDGYAKITAVKLDGITNFEINRGNVPIDYKYNIYNYDLTVDNDIENIRFNITTEEGYNLTQSNRSTDMTDKLSVTNTITLTDNETGVVQIYTVTVKKQNAYLENRSSVSYGYSYTGDYEKFYVPATGIYTLETWGAQGGHRGSNNGGKGAYSKADMYLVKGEVLYIYVGGSGSTTTKDGLKKGYNGGGHTVGYYTTGGVWHETTNTYGGGATDIRYGGNTLYNRVLVAGGGGSVGASGYAGGAGGVSASSGCGSGGTAGSINAAGSYRAGFGYGGDGTFGSGGYAGAGGGGWYGGGGANPDHSQDDDKGGGGGSNFAFTSENSKYVPEGYLVTDKNYLTNASLINGDASFLSPTGSNETGHAGNGYVRISPKLINGVADITINDGTVPIDFDYTIYEYNISVLDSVNSITVSFQLNDGYSMVESHTGSYDITNSKQYVYSVDVKNDITGLTVNYKITFHKQSDYLMSGTTGSYGYEYSGLPQKFIAPAAGIYTLEAWGAQGGHRGANNGGAGGYSTGQIFLNKGQILYVYVGSNGNNGGWNGGGKAGYGTIYGGGASDIRLGGQSLYNRLIVAGGGGSVGASGNTGGVGGGTSGGGGAGNYGDGAQGASQTSGGANSGTFGKGGSGIAANGGYGGGGGGGWYGGGGAGVDGSGDDDRGGGGGSGFIWTESNASIVPDEYLLSSSQYLSEASTKAGNTSFPAPKGGNETGHTGNGFVKISFSLSYDYDIIVSDNVTLDKEFDYDTKEYTGTLSSNDSSLVTFTVTDSDSILKVDGDGKQEIHVGDNTYNITITYINGAVEVFTYHIHREANDIDYLNNIYFDEHSISEFSDKTFDKDTLTYNVTLPYYMDEYDLTVDKGSADQIITNIGHISNKNNTYKIPISVTNETGTSTKTYTLNITLPHSSKIKKLTFNSSGGSVIEIPIPNDQTEFDIEFESHIAAVNTIVDLYDNEAQATVTGDGYIESDNFDITINVTEPHVDATTNILHAKRVTVSGYEKDLSYNGNVQTVIIPYDHEYLLEVWGAQGGNGGGRGGYSYGNIYLTKGTILYVYAGGSGASGGFNGGGTSRVGKGGGASDIRIGTDSLYSRVIVAGGGGGHGSDGCASGAVGGGLNGGGTSASGSCGTQAGGGTQTEGGTYGKYSSAIGTIGKFGIGANAPTSGGNYYGGGGGGGWYGGGSGATSGWSNGGGGGSGFIYTEENASVIENDSKWLLNSDYYLTNANTLSGSNSFTSPTGAKETGHAGNGYAKITIPYQESENNYLDGIISNKGVMTPDWDYNTDTYYLTLASDEVEINIEGVPSDGKASVVGNGDYIIEAGTTEIPLVVTAENGYTKTYKVVVTREADTNDSPKNILINGLLQEYCSSMEGACIYEFDENTNSYQVKVPYTIREIVMVVDKAHYFQTVNGDGLYELSGGSNKFQIDVTSEDKNNTTSWYYDIYRDMTGNADLRSLKMTSPEYDINYSYNITDYYVTVPHETENVEIEAIADDPNATVKITKPDTLDYGQNTIKITVTAQNGTEKQYTIYVTRLESNNAFLTDLTVTDITNKDNPKKITLSPEFNKMNLKYDLEVENSVSKISLTGTLEDELLATSTGLQEYDLNVGANTINVVVTAQDGSSLTYTIVVRRKANSNTLLADLTVDEATLTEKFESTKFVYYLYVTGEVEKLTINATPQAATSTYQIIGNYNNLIAGKNEITIRVTSEDKSTCDYKLIVNRTGYNDNYLQSLLVTNGNENYILTPNFDPLYDKYVLNLPNDITNVVLTATSNGKKRASIGNSSVYVKNINLLSDNPSENNIVVTAEDGTTRTYSVIITREKSSDNTLSSLEVEENTLIPNFNPDTLNYSFTTNDHSLNIKAVPNNKYAKVVISDNAKNLVPGENIITITVTSENGVEKVYTLTVIRELSSDNTLKTLEVKDIILNPSFDPNTLEYSFDTHKVNIEITAIPNNKYAKVEIIGNLKLNLGLNEIEIKVTSETGDIRIYKINANFVLDDNNYLSNLTTNTGLEQEFSKELLEYTKTTEDSRITINATLESKNATYSITDSTGNIIDNFPQELTLGENIFFVNVTAQNGNVRTYKITINRNKSSDSKLSNLTTSEGLNEEFNSESYQYTLNTKAHNLTITPTVRNEYASYKIYDINGDIVDNDINLITGSNIYMIIVTAEDNTTSTYNLVINRLDNNIATIDSLGITTNETFDKNTFNYTITTDESSLNLDNIVLTDSYATYTVEGNSNFSSDQIQEVLIKVTAEDKKTTNTYKLTVTKVVSTDSRLEIFKLGNYEFTPKFDKDTTTYEVFIPSTLTDANLELKTLKNTATIKSIMIDNNEQVTTSSNSYKNIITIPDITTSSNITITVKAEDNTETTYTLTLTDEVVINNYLSTLNVSCGNLDPVFDRETTSYTVFTESNVTSCTVLATKEVDIATITGNGDYNFPANEKYLDIPITVTSSRGEERVYNVKIRRPLSNESRLSNLELSTYILDPVFQSDTYEYNVTVPNFINHLSKDNFTYTTLDPDSTVTFEDKDLVSGTVTKYTIVSTSEDGTNKSTYILNVSREKSSDTTISSVTVTVSDNKFSCNMDPTSKLCTIEVPSNTSDFTLEATLPDMASVNPANPSKHILLETEYNKDISLTVTAEDDTTDTYTVRIIRSESSNNDLMDLQVNYVSLPNFSSTKLSYEKTVIGTMNQVMITAVLADTKATVVTDLSKPFNLEYGLNTIEIVVRAEDKTEKTYTIEITRCDSVNAQLSSLSVKNYPFEETYDPEETEYTIRVPRTKKTLTRDEIIYSLADKNASITLDNKLDIDFDKTSNIYTITVTAGDGVVQKYYHISVLPELSTNNNVDKIVVDGVEIKPNSDKEFSYDIFDTDTNATLTSITLSNEYALHNVMLPQKLTYDNKYQFMVTAENGDVAIYTVNLVRSKTRELKLANIEANFQKEDDCSGICTFDKVFNEDTTNYEIYIPNEITSLDDLVITPKNNLQTYEIIGNSNLSVGENTIIIRVKNSLNETFDYTLTVYREASSDPNILGISFITPEYEITDFDENLYEYNVEFNAIESGKYELDVEKKNDNQQIEIKGAKVLYFGRNDIIVHSKSESCSTTVKTRYGCNEKDYIIHAYRNEKYSNLLASLTISSGDTGDFLQVFNKYKFDYVLEVDSEISTVKIEGTAVNTTHATVSGNGEFNLTPGLNTFQIIVTPEIGDPATYTLNIIRKQSDNVNLANLKVTGYELSPAFVKNTVDYYINIDSTVNQLDIIYTKEAEDQLVYITGNSNFVTGENIVNVVVLSADKTRGKTYKIHANRSASDNNLLNGITVFSMKNDIETIYPLTPDFNNEVNDYTVNVSKDISEINIKTIKGQKMQTIVGNGSYILDYGINVIPITVTSESGLVNTYNITINREFEFGLNSLTVSHDDTIYDLDPVFDPDTLEYNVSVDYEIDSVIVDATLKETLNDIDGLGEYQLNTGNNDIVITVSYGENSRDYIIHVNRKKCSDNSLKSLQVAEGLIDPNFNKDILEYNVDIPYEYDSATVIYETNSKDATVEIRNNTDLEIGITKDIEVIVTAENGDIKTYIIHATKLPKPTASNRLINMYIDEATLEPVFNIGIMNYTAEVLKDTKRVNLHLQAEEKMYSTVEVYKLGSTTKTKVDMKVDDPKIMLNVDAGKNSFVIRVTNYEGSVRNYQLDIYRAGPNEARIKNLSFDYGTLAPVFDKNKNAYTMEVENTVTKLTETVTMMDEKATYTISGNKNLKIGENTITITTLAQDGKTSLEYTIIVTKKASSNAYLSDIVTFPEKDFTFDKEKYNYIYHVESNINTIQIIGIREDTTAKITGNGIYQLTGEDLTVKLTVVAQDGTTKVYTVVVTKKKDSNANLESLTINNGELVPNFDKDTLEYTVELENYIDSINVTGKSESDKATVSGNGNYNLVEGKNKIQIMVTAEDGTIKTYTITVTRKENELEQTLLEDLSVLEGALTPDFNPNTLNYIVNIPNEYESATVTYKVHNPDAVVDIYGNDNLEVGHNIITVKVSYNGEATTYTIDAIRQEASNTYLSVLSVMNHDITPEFDKTIQNYTLTVANNIASIELKATPELSTSTVYIKKDTDYKETTGVTTINLTPGENTIYIKVVSISKAERVYKLVVTRENSDENKLLTLESSTGNITPKFDKDINSYTLNVPVGTKYVTLSGTVSENATVNGLETYPLTVGTVTKYITVTSQSGLVNTYEVTIVREASHDALITNIKPSVGSLNPSFTSDIKSYTIEVEGDVNNISFDVTTNSKDALVVGNGVTTLFAGKNIITITSIAEDGITQESVNIEVYKKTDIISFDTDLEINVPVGNDYQIDIKYNPENTDYKGMTYTVNNKSILTVSDTGLITPLTVGDTTITITSTRNKSLTKTVTVHVINPVIQSDTYYINRDDEDNNYITGMEPNTIVDDFLSNLKNERENLKVYSADENLVDIEDTAKTKYVVKLIINGTVYDQLVLVLKGDIDGDGAVTVADVLKTRGQILRQESLDYIELKAADIDMDNSITVADVLKMRGYILRQTSSLNEDLKKYLEQES